MNCTPTIRQFFRSSNHGTPADGNPYAEENGGYAKSGPLPTVDIVSEQHLGTEGEAIPTYSTADKSKKKDKKKDKKAGEQKRTEDQDAVVT